MGEILPDGTIQGYNVFSAFNGIGCGFVALERAGIKVNKIYVSEIDDRANTIQRKNWPQTIFYGNIEKIKKEHFLSPIDLLMGGSPCQDLSIAGKMAGLSGSRSKLFFEFVRLKKELNPTYFFFENVRMKKESQDKISELLGCEPIYFDSALVSAQTRKRLYWTNIVSAADFVYPHDRGITLNDILETNDAFFISGTFRSTIKSVAIDANYFKGIYANMGRTCVKVGDAVDFKLESSKRVYHPLGKNEKQKETR